MYSQRHWNSLLAHDSLFELFTATIDCALSQPNAENATAAKHLGNLRMLSACAYQYECARVFVRMRVHFVRVTTSLTHFLWQLALAF